MAAEAGEVGRLKDKVRSEMENSTKMVQTEPMVQYYSCVHFQKLEHLNTEINEP